ncbi:hypothetical protein [Myxosarcina sp. GI1]|uniref:hypothetical protein n=1 Tax=Myxosarcina sp. GI1 TaxID=1541065 RepID=UPI0012E04963|nr:hypothetical protein [Myxosarcina sp. GI1]
MGIGLSGGLLSSMASREDFINRLSGEGEIYLQSRSIKGFLSFLTPKMLKHANSF